jgi:hypothetical protein
MSLRVVVTGATGTVGRATRICGPDSIGATGFRLIG